LWGAELISCSAPQVRLAILPSEVYELDHEWLKERAYLAGIGNFVLTLVFGLIALLAEKGLTVVLLLLMLGLTTIVFVLLLKQERARLKGRERFIAGEGFESIRLDANQLLTQFDQVAGIPFGVVVTY
jgi:hypothetical protein